MLGMPIVDSMTLKKLTSFKNCDFESSKIPEIRSEMHFSTPHSCKMNRI
jgi:hypothetical protein